MGRITTIMFVSVILASCGGETPRHEAEQAGWLVLCLHGVGEDVGWEPWSAANLSAFAAWIRQNGVTGVTIAEGAKRFFGEKTVHKGNG